MKKLLVLLIPALLFAQIEVDTVVHLPTFIMNGLFFPELNKLYLVGCYEHDLLDCSTYQVVARIPRSYDDSYGYCSWNWRRQKLYVGFNPDPDSLVVIDVKADTLVKAIARSGMGNAYVASTDRLYRGVDQNLVALDCAADTVVCTIPSPVSGYSFLYPSWDSVGNKLYVSLDAWGLRPKVAVYDCVTDSLLTVIDIPSPYRAFGLHFDYPYRKAYYNIDGPSGAAGVIDTRSDKVIKTFPFTSCTVFNTGVALNSKDHKAYVVGADSAIYGSALYVVDCDADTIVKKLVFPKKTWPVDLARWVPWSNRVYLTYTEPIAHQDLGMYVVDCKTDSIIVSNLVLGYWPPYEFQIDPVHERVFAIGSESTTIHVLRDTGYGGVAQTKQAEPRLASGLQVRMMRGLFDIEYSVAAPCRVDLSVYDLMGCEVRRLAAGKQSAGRNSVVWNCTDRTGTAVARGVYFIRLNTPGRADVTKVVVTRWAASRQ
ncbi:MAG TPA: FlgD immunoglobulin-like domain containing protein [bacterium]|nr:FlgD immunoglobulin-like domain containing protein [bacterium]